MTKTIFALPVLLAAVFASPTASADAADGKRATLQECRAYWGISPAASSQRCVIQTISTYGADGCTVTANCPYNGQWITSGATVTDKWELGRLKNCSGRLGTDC
ncbi:hypothetical protein QT383_16920 [Stenotrophomonas rhizophila]